MSRKVEHILTWIVVLLWAVVFICLFGAPILWLSGNGPLAWALLKSAFYGVVITLVVVILTLPFPAELEDFDD